MYSYSISNLVLPSPPILYIQHALCLYNIYFVYFYTRSQNCFFLCHRICIMYIPYIYPHIFHISPKSPHQPPQASFSSNKSAEFMSSLLYNVLFFSLSSNNSQFHTNVLFNVLESIICTFFSSIHGFFFKET